MAEIDDRQRESATEPGVSADPSFTCIGKSCSTDNARLSSAELLERFQCLALVAARNCSCDLLTPPPTMNKSGAEELSRALSSKSEAFRPTLRKAQ